MLELVTLPSFSRLGGLFGELCLRDDFEDAGDAGDRLVGDLAKNRFSSLPTRQGLSNEPTPSSPR